MRVGVLTQWFEPEPGPAALPSVLARGLAARGHDVQVVTGFPNYPTGKVMDGYRVARALNEKVDGVDIRRVALFPSHGAGIPGRLANYGSFGLSALVSGVGALRKCDAVWVNYSPITIAPPMLAAHHVFGVPMVTHVLDLWPDTLFASGFAGEGAGSTLARSVLNRWCSAMYSASESVAYIAPSVGGILRERGVPEEKLRYVPMWANEEVFHPSDRDMREQLNLRNDSIVVLYAGAMGPAQGLDTLIDAMGQVDDPRLVCVLAGSGISEATLRERAMTTRADIRFLGRVPPESMTQLMATADIAYIGLRAHEHSAATMPSKTQATLAAGRAALVAADGDVRDVLTDSGAGIPANPGSAKSVASALRIAISEGRHGLASRGARGREYYERTFAADTAVDTIETLLTNAALKGKVRT